MTVVELSMYQLTREARDRKTAHNTLRHRSLLYNLTLHSFRKKGKTTLKKTIFLTIAISFAALLQGQQLLSKEHEEIQQTVVNMFQALSNRDSIVLKNYCSLDVTFFEYGQIWNIDTLIRKAIAMNHSADFERTNTFEFIHTESSKTTAWVTYRLNSIITKDAKKTDIQWLETVVLTKQRKPWKVKHLHSTMIKRG